MRYYGNGLDPSIVGKSVYSVDVDADRERLTVRFTDGSTSEYLAEGDCCSSSWIEHLTVPVDILGATVTAVGDSDEVKQEEHTDYELLQIYHSFIATDRGLVIIEYRNSSNGYYGGSLRCLTYKEPD